MQDYHTNKDAYDHIRWAVFFLICLIVILASCKGDKKESTNHAVSEDSATLYLKHDTTNGFVSINDFDGGTNKTLTMSNTYAGVYVEDGFTSNLRYIDMVEGGITADSVFELVIKNAATRDTSGNWKIYDSKKALEVLWQLYLTQIHDKIKITHK